MKRWITSDLHLGEPPERLARILRRPFDTTQGHIDHLLASHNALVGPEDEVIVLGDVCYKYAPQYLEAIRDFNGNKTLVRGNHDEVFGDAELLKYFDLVVSHGDGIELDLPGVAAWATHYPTRGRPDRFNLVGHVHAAWKVQLNMLNVGVDTNHFRPHDLSEIRFHLQAICDFYDDDVWVGYDPINLDHAAKRGRPGSYFKGEER